MNNSNINEFFPGEKVLCYDPNKEKLLYDAKIIGIRNCKDDSGRNRKEFLVHFSGWKKAYDR